MSCLVATLVVAGLSYRLIELPFLARKARFTPAEPDAARTTEPALH